MDYLLLENGDYILKEDGSKISLETRPEGWQDRVYSESLNPYSGQDVYSEKDTPYSDRDVYSNKSSPYTT